MNTLQESPSKTPLVTVIGREIRERATSIALLEERLESFANTRKTHAQDITNLQAELAIHRRELRRCQKELVQLGCTIDEADPMRILCGDDESVNLEDTHFWSAADTPG